MFVNVIELLYLEKQTSNKISKEIVSNTILDTFLTWQSYFLPSSLASIRRFESILLALPSSIAN